MQQTFQRHHLTLFVFLTKLAKKYLIVAVVLRMISTVELKFGFIVNLDGRNRVISDLYTYLPTQAD